ncbi:MAG: SNF2-related protein [Dehalococcoidia bacterium]
MGLQPSLSGPGPRPVANDFLTGTMDDRLKEAFFRVLPTDVNVATAYLTPDGFMRLKEGMSGASRVNLLLGERPFLNRRGPEERLRQPGDDDDLAGPEEAIDWHAFLEGDYPWILLTHARRKELLENKEADPEAVAAFSTAAWEKVRALVQFLQRDGVEVRRFLADKAGKVPDGQVLSHKTTSSIRLHAKTYLLRGEGAAFAAVGSSNLTVGGLTQNIELNLTSYDEPLVAQLEAWFVNKWLQGQDCRAEFIRLLEECVLFGRRFTPWQVFIKALHAAYGRYLDLAITEDIASKLAEFQQEAVSRCVTLLDRHWGAMLCDSVGLGKTYEGLGIVGEFARRRQESTNKTVHALVVCPAQLMNNWTQEKLLSYGIVGETISMETLPTMVVEDEDAETPLERMRREKKLRHLQSFDIVLVDESHNFRNPATKRYRALQQIIRGAGEMRVVLMTATPINNTPWDLYYQLSLVTRGDDTWYAGRGPVANLRNTFRAIESGANGTGLLDTMLLSLVRRTRHDVRAMQDAGKPMELAGQEMRFPHHEIPKALSYSLEALYGGIYREVTATIEGLKFAVYDLESYGVQTGDTDTSERLKQRNSNFIGIMRTIFLKRMESSVVALMSTVRSMVEYSNLFLAQLDEGRVVTPKDAQRLRAALGGSLPDDSIEAAEWDQRARRTVQDSPKAPSDPVDLERLKAAVTADRDRLAGLLQSLEATEVQWEQGNDPKLQALRALLESLPATDRHGVPTKVVLFTNYKDTADYIFKQLGGPRGYRQQSRRVASNLSDHRWMALLTGADDHRRRAEVLQYFAPLAFHRETEAPDDPILLERVAPFRDEGIDLLIATDVLSEGQNLQDAQYLVNYDLHWNPVRMIQRAGRIDRLFSPHERVYFYNLMPEQELESLLKLVGRLSVKVASIEDMVGLDASVLGEQIEAKAFDQIMQLAAGGAKAEAVYREGEQAQGLDLAFAELQRYVTLVKDLGTEEVRDVPDGVYSVRLGPQAGVFIMLRMPEELSGQVYWRFYPLSESQARTAASEVLGLIEATRDDQRLDLPPDENPFTYLVGPLNAAINQLGEEYKSQVAERTQDEFTRRLANLLARDDVVEAEPELWEKLHIWRQDPPPTDSLDRPKVRDWRRLIRTTAAGERLDVVLERLTGLWQGLSAEGLDRPFAKPAGHTPTVRDLQLVCWELVLTKKVFDEFAARA